MKEFSRGVLAKRDRKLCDTDPASKQPVGGPVRFLSGGTIFWTARDYPCVRMPMV